MTEIHTNCVCDFKLTSKIPLPDFRIALLGTERKQSNPTKKPKRVDPSPWRLGSTKYPYLKMKVGESFLVPYKGKDSKKLKASMAGSHNYFSQHTAPKLGLGYMRFRVTQEKKGIRVWRTK